MPVPADEANHHPAAITNHSAHPGHTLKRVAEDAAAGQLFVCDGCKQPGAGARYRCEQERCNFDLHTCCAVAPATLTLTHPAVGARREFLFLQQPEPPRASTGGIKGGGRSCTAVDCRQPVRGFVYHCFDNDIDLHPCCARLLEDAVIRGGDNRRVPDARHRRWDGGKAGKRDPPPAEKTQPMSNRVVLEVRRQEVSRPGDRARGREGAPAARHRSWTWKRWLSTTHGLPRGP